MVSVMNTQAADSSGAISMTSNNLDMTLGKLPTRKKHKFL